MPAFRYAGYKPDGSRVDGIIEASSEREASIKLKDLGIYPSLLEYQRHTYRFRRNEGLSLITRQLSTLLEAGIPLIDALGGMAQEASPFISKVLNEIREKVSEGSSLSKALEDHIEIFPDFYINMVKAAEMSGELPEVLKKIAEYLEAQESMKSRLRTAMVYPLTMLLVATGVLLFIFIYVMPRIVRIFETSKTGLPLITKILITVTKFLQTFWFLIPVLILGLLYALRLLKRQRPELVDKWLLKDPLRILIPLYLARFTKILSFLLEGGVPMIKALDVSAKSTGNKIIEQLILNASRAVAEGGRLSSSLEGLPNILIELIANGEKSGRLIENLKVASKAYDEEFSRRLTRTVSLIEPAMILIMGGIVFFVVLGVVLPIFELNQLIKL